MKSTKTSWKSFLENKELMYIGSVFEKTVEEVENLIDILKPTPFELNRTFAGGVTDIKFKTESGSISHLTKRGIVYAYGDYFLIFDKSNGNNIVVYRVK